MAITQKAFCCEKSLPIAYYSLHSVVIFWYFPPYDAADHNPLGNNQYNPVNRGKASLDPFWGS